MPNGPMKSLVFVGVDRDNENGSSPRRSADAGCRVQCTRCPIGSNDEGCPRSHDICGSLSFRWVCRTERVASLGCLEKILPVFGVVAPAPKNDPLDKLDRDEFAVKSPLSSSRSLALAVGDGTGSDLADILRVSSRVPPRKSSPEIDPMKLGSKEKIVGDRCEVPADFTGSALSNIGESMGLASLRSFASLCGSLIVKLTSTPGARIDKLCWMPCRSSSDNDTPR